jgi:tight adherence protein B
VSRAALWAGVAGAAAVLGLWEALAAAEAGGAARLAAALEPLLQAGTDGLEPSAGLRRRLGVVAAATVLAAGWLLGGPVAGLVLAALAPAAALQVVAARRRRWRAAVAAGAPAAARALADALGAGHAIRGAVAEAARTVPGAAGAELAAAARALALGEETDAAIERLRVRAGTDAWDTMAAAIGLQREAGGDLAALLRGVADAAEEAARLERDARQATAQARFTGGLVCGLPLAAAGLAELADPRILATVVGSPIGAGLTLLALVVQAGSLLAIRRLARVEGPAGA